jgi:hypothetical protein
MFSLAICPSLLQLLLPPRAYTMPNETGLLSESEGDEDMVEMTRGDKPRTAKKSKPAKGDSKGSGDLRADASEKKKVTTVMKEHKPLLSLMIKQILATQQASRDAMQVLYDVYITAADLVLIVVAMAQNTLYNKKIQKKGRGHGLGPPFLWTAQGILVGITKMLEGARKDEANKILDHWNKASMEEKSDLIRFCRVVKTFESDTKKLVMSWGASRQAQEYRSVFMGFMTSFEQVQFKVGRPPAGYMERELALWLKELIN